jgi:DNA mismatch endonuclease (patch repair protein)
MPNLGGTAKAGPPPADEALRTVRSALHRLGYRFRLGPNALPGSPPIVLPRWRLAVFVVECGCHPHADCRQPLTRHPADGGAEARRLSQACDELARLGWETLVVQACDAQAPEALSDRLDIALQGRLIALTADANADALDA